MPAIRPVSDIADKWKRVAPTRVPDYEAGIKSPKKSWEKETVAAEARWDEGVKKAATDKRFGKGVRKAGQGKWSRKTLAVGPERWPRGVEVAGPDYEAGFAPFRDTIEKTDIGARYPAGDPRNYDRVRKMGEALHSAKLALLK